MSLSQLKTNFLVNSPGIKSGTHDIDYKQLVVIINIINQPINK
jgi:hypothetical protein